MCRSNNKRLANGEDLYIAHMLGLPLCEKVTPDHRKMLEALAKSDVEWARARTSKQASYQASDQQNEQEDAQQEAKQQAKQEAKRHRTQTKFLNANDLRANQYALHAAKQAAKQAATDQKSAAEHAKSAATGEVDRGGYYQRQNGKLVFVEDSEVDRDGYYTLDQHGELVFVEDSAAHCSTSESSTSEDEEKRSYDEEKETQYLSDEWADALQRR